MSKQREREIKERLADLKLKVGQTSGYEVTSSFHLTQAQLERQKNQREWDELKLAEREAEELLKREQHAFKQQQQQWSTPIAQLQAQKGFLIPDLLAELPLTTQPLSDLQETYENFIALQRSKDIVYSKNGLARLICYCEVMSRTAQTAGGVTRHVALDSLDAWRLADLRLLEYGAYQDGERGELLVEPEAKDLTEPSASELLREANAGWFAMFSATWDAWLASLAQDPWNFHPNENQKIAALKMLQQFGTTPDSWDRTRRCLGRSGVWPNLATADEVLAEKVEAGEFRLHTEEGRRAYMIAHNQVTYKTV